MSIEVVGGIITAVFLAWIWHIARTPGTPAPPRESTLTPARQEELRRVGAAVGCGSMKGSDYEYWSNALKPRTGTAGSRPPHAKRRHSGSVPG